MPISFRLLGKPESRIDSLNTQYLSPGERTYEIKQDVTCVTMTAFKREIFSVFCQYTKVRLTFKESKFPVFPFKSGIDMSGQSPPKVTDRHGISIQNMVVTYPPEPFILKEKRDLITACWTNCHIKGPTRLCEFTLNTNISPLRIAMVSKCPSQMLGPKRGLSGEYVGSGLWEGVRGVTGGG